MIDLQVPLHDARDLYGEPLETSPSDEVKNATSYTFYGSPFHTVVVCVIDSRIETVFYWSMRADPKRDLEHMFKYYGEGQAWEPLTPGYSYIRKDRLRVINCSAIPAIGVVTQAFLEAERLCEDKKA